MFRKSSLSFRVDAGLDLARATLDIVFRIRNLARVLRHRREVMHLAELDDRTLKDIGLLRSDVTGALGEPYSADPSRILVMRRHERRSIARSREPKTQRPVVLRIPLR